jgi:hypothetical protein
LHVEEGDVAWVTADDGIVGEALGSSLADAEAGASSASMSRALMWWS